MKQSATIHSIRCRVRYDETELERRYNQQTGKTWLSRWRITKAVTVVDGYTKLSTTSFSFPLNGTVEIAVRPKSGKICLVQVPCATRFFFTFPNQSRHNTGPAFAISLS